ncbi:MAG: ankyrin repeat domain-containing protein [bacterium]
MRKLISLMLFFLIFLPGFLHANELIDEIEKGNLVKVKELIATGADVNMVFKNGNRSKIPLVLAAEKGDPAIIEFLISKGAVIDPEVGYGLTPLMKAAYKGHAEVVDLLIKKGAEINNKNRFNDTALIYASQNGHIQTVKLLISLGAEINVKDSVGKSPLSHACDCGNAEIVKILVENGAHVDSRSSQDRTPLFCTSSNGYVEMADFLISKGADINSKDFSGESPLAAAAKNGHLDMVKLLLAKGANIRDKTPDEFTPLLYAAMNNHLEIVKYLVSSGADVNTFNYYGYTPLFYASFNGNMEMVRFLLSSNAYVNKKDNTGKTSLTHALSNSQIDVAEFLKSKGAVDGFEPEEKHDRDNSIEQTAKMDNDNSKDAGDEYSDEEKIKYIYGTWIEDNWYKQWIGDIRNLYAISNIEYKILEKVSGHRIFVSGPHKDGIEEWNTTRDFGHYNKDFVLWARDNMIPGAEDLVFRKITQKKYDSILSGFARSFYEAYVKLKKDSNYMHERLEDYKRKIEQGSHFDGDDYTCFWLRRHMDGTENEFFLCLEKLLKTYDNSFLKQFETEINN